MQYSVEIYDDEISPKKWRPVAFAIESVVGKETYRAMGGCKEVQPTIRKITTDLKEAEAKKSEMIQLGWKARIKEER